MTKIFLDAGHGGQDGGAAGNEIKEKDINLKIIHKIYDLLQDYQDVEIVLSRNTDKFLSLSERTKLANLEKADCFVSVHINASTSTSARGFETYRYINAKQSTIAFQNVMHEEIYKQIKDDCKDRGKNSANFHVLRESTMKAILSENLFISNAADAKLLKSDAFLDKLARGHVNGLEKFFGLKKKGNEVAEPIKEPTKEPAKAPAKKKLFYVQCGAFEQENYAKELFEQLVKDGYNPYIKYE